MIKFVIGMNIAIALLGFYLAWRIWQVRRTLVSTTIALTAWERQLQEQFAPDKTTAMLLESQQTIALTRERYARLRTQLHQLQRIFTIALVALRLFQRGMRRR